MNETLFFFYAPDRTAGRELILMIGAAAIELRSDRTFWTRRTRRSVVVLRRAGRRGGSAAADRRRPARCRRRRGRDLPHQLVVTAVESPRRRRPHPRSRSCTCCTVTRRPVAHWPAGAAARRAGEHEDEEERDDGGHPLPRDAERRRSCRHGERRVRADDDDVMGQVKDRTGALDRSGWAPAAGDEGGDGVVEMDGLVDRLSESGSERSWRGSGRGRRVGCVHVYRLTEAMAMQWIEMDDRPSVRVSCV